MQLCNHGVMQVSASITPWLHSWNVCHIHHIHIHIYILTKKLCRKFCTQISSSQSEKRTMVFTREKNDTSNQNRERCFFTCEKKDTSNQKPQRCVSFAPKFPPFIAACSAASHTFSDKSFIQRVFLAKKVKNISEMEWPSRPWGNGGELSPENIPFKYTIQNILLYKNRING